MECPRYEIDIHITRLGPEMHSPLTSWLLVYAIRSSASSAAAQRSRVIDLIINRTKSDGSITQLDGPTSRMDAESVKEKITIVYTASPRHLVIASDIPNFGNENYD